MLYSLVLLAWEAVHLIGINRLQALQSRKVIPHWISSYFKEPCLRPNFSSLEKQMDKYDNVKYFKTSLSHRQHFLTRDILKVCTDTLTTNNITFFMTAGTLLGSYMHHGMIPWDDDLDLFFPVSEKARIYAALLKLQPKYSVVKVYIQGGNSSPRSQANSKGMNGLGLLLTWYSMQIMEDTFKKLIIQTGTNLKNHMFFR